MQITAKIETTIDIDSIVIKIPSDEVEFNEMWEGEEAVSLPMFKTSPGTYTFVVDADTGRIRNWPKGITASATFKVCDRGTYSLIGKNGQVVADIEENYVPSCIPGKYGDYIEFEILGDGTWDGFGAAFKPTKIASSFFKGED